MADYIIRTEFQFSPSIYPSDKAALVKLKRHQKLIKRKVKRERVMWIFKWTEKKH